MGVIKSKVVFSFIMLIVLVLLSGLLWLRYDSNIKQFNTLQLTLMQQQAEQAAKGINDTLSHIRHQMSAISLDDLWLQDLADFSEDTDVQEQLANRFRLYFPRMHSYVITNSHGEQIGGDYDFYIEQVCQADINQVASMLSPEVEYFDYEPYIHPKPGAYHFDIMMPVFAKGRELIFFMSFDAVILQKILFEKMISEHQMFLVRKDVPELIEVSTQAVRDKLNRSISLSQEELSRVKAITDIPDSRWKIVVLENPDLMSSQQLDTFMDTAVLYVVLLLFWFSVLWLGLHYEVSRGKLLTRLSHLSNHDELTEVANRRKLLSNLEFSIQTARRHGEYAAILYLDLNGFKQINDDFGHDMGDSVLINCANRLRTLTRSGDLVARLGGDEFVVLLNNLGSDVEKAKMIIDRKVAVIRDSLDRPYSYKNITGRCMPSIGVRLITAEDSDVEELLNHADKLMYQDKQKTKQDDA